MIAAIMLARDEDDVIGPVLMQLLAQGIDRIWVADNLSKDKTRPLLDEMAAHLPITVIDDPIEGYYQSNKTSALARMAFDAGADWIVPCDADEWWYGLGGTIAEMLTDVDADVVFSAGFDHLAQVGDDSGEINPIRRMGWRRHHRQSLMKVCFRAAPQVYVHMGNHGVEHPGGRNAQGLLEFRHYQYRTLEQATHKVRQGAAAYAASTVHEKHGTHWKELAALTDAELAGWWDALCATPDLVYDPAPMR